MRHTRHKRFPGIYRGTVIAAVEDGRGRLIITVPDVFGPGGIAPPAMSGMGGGASPNFGSCWVPPDGSSVWVMFQFGGNPANPVWFPGWVAAESAASDLGDAFQGKDDVGEQPPRGSDYGEDADEVKYYEPEPRSLGVYPNVRGWRSEAGHIIIMDDTEGDELMQFTHADGAMIEWSKGGSELHRVPGNQHEVIYGSVTRHMRSDVIEIIDGDVNRTVHGDLDETVVGTRTIGRSGTITDTHDGDMNETIQGEYNKTLGSEVRKVKNSQQIVISGASQTSDRYRAETHQESRSSFTVGDMADSTKDVHANQVMSGNILNEVVVAGNVVNKTLLGDVSSETLAGDAKLKTTAGTASLESVAGEAKVSGTQANLAGTATCGIDAPITTVGIGSSALVGGSGGTPVAKVGSKSTGFATLGPLNLSATVFVIDGSSQLFVKG